MMFWFGLLAGLMAGLMIGILVGSVVAGGVFFALRHQLAVGDTVLE